MVNSFKQLLKSQRGQGSMLSFFTFLLGLIMIAVFLPMMNEVVGTAMNGNMANLSFVSTINLLLGMSGILMVIMFFMGVISDFQTRQIYTQ